MTRETITYKGLSIRDPAPYGEAGLAWQENFVTIADTLDSLQGSLDTALGGLVIGVDIQAYSANLDTWSSIAPSADAQALAAAADYAAIRDLLDLEVGKDVQAHSANLDTWSSVAPSANGKSLVAAADYAAMRGLLDLVVGVDIQAYSANLDTWSSIAPSADAQALAAAADYAAIRDLLDLEVGKDVQAHSANLDTWSSVAPSANGKSLVAAADYAAMRGLLDLVVGVDIQAYSANLDTWSSIAPSADAQALAAAADYAAIRDLLDLEVGKDVQAHSANLDTWSSVAPSANGKSLVAAADYAAMRGLLDLVVGVDIQAYSANLDTWSSIAPSADAQALAAAADYAAIRGLLDLEPGVDIQAHSANLDTWSSIAPSADGQSLVAAADYAAMRGLLGVRPGADVQGYSAELGAIAGLTPIDGNVIVGDGTTWVAESGATARASLGLGSMATQEAGDVAITGGAITGITDLAVADGGTGASDAAGARANLGFTAPILDRTAPGDIGATTPGAGSFTTLTSGEHSILSDTVGLKLDAAGTTTLYGNGSYLVTNRGMVNPGTLVEVAGKNQSMVYGHDGTYAYLVYQPYVWSGSAWTATNNFGFGLRALERNTGTVCAGVGYYALYGNTGNQCAGLGVLALSSNQGAESSGIGSTVLQYNTGDNSTGFGSRAGRYNTGSSLVALGHRSAEQNIGIDTSLVGMRSGYYNTGRQAAGLGYYTLYNNTGDNVVALGYYSGRYNTGNYNTFLGSHIGFNFDPNDSAAKTFDHTAVDPITDRITIPAHGFGAAGQYKNLKFTQGTSPITGLTSGNIYQAKIIDANTIGLNEPDGPNGTTRTIANITAAGTGTGHTFTPQYEYSNATCVGANSAPSASNQVTLGDTAVTEVKTSGVILPGGYKASDGSAGISKTITITDKSDTTHTLVFKDGLLTSHTEA